MSTLLTPFLSNLLNEFQCVEHSLFRSKLRLVRSRTTDVPSVPFSDKVEKVGNFVSFRSFQPSMTYSVDTTDGLDRPVKGEGDND